MANRSRYLIGDRRSSSGGENLDAPDWAPHLLPISRSRSRFQRISGEVLVSLGFYLYLYKAITSDITPRQQV